MPQMHPLMWALLFAFSLFCLMITLSILFFSLAKLNLPEEISMKPAAKKLIWKW